ncbi:MAG: hypothetical protein KBS41_04785 [Oscillospiraceae bacterium]|nr:hypothetical protein [Candidatus Equicaccousia limihippi]
MQNILVMGGDTRQSLLSQKLNKMGYNTAPFEIGLTKRDFDRIILPYPTTKDGENLFAPLLNKTVSLESIYKYVKKGGMILGGNMPKSFIKNSDYTFTDYAKNEKLLYKNAMLTAQAAISLIINRTKKPIYKSKILVIGLGRIGSLLTDYLKSLGANLTAVTGDSKKIECYSLMGIKTVKSEEILTVLNNQDIIVNTSPNILLSGENLKAVNQDTIYFELASPPYGIDLKAAQKMSLQYEIASGLPGKYFPESACKYILEAILPYLGE